MDLWRIKLVVTRQTRWIHSESIKLVQTTSSSHWGLLPMLNIWSHLAVKILQAWGSTALSDELSFAGKLEVAPTCSPSNNEYVGNMDTAPWLLPPHWIVKLPNSSSTNKSFCGAGCSSRAMPDMESQRFF